MTYRFSLMVLFAALMGSGALVAQESPHKNLDFACSDCHVTQSFSDIRFDHDKTGFLLEGRHKTATCSGCHDISDFSTTSGTCATCHEDIHLGKAGNDCEKCHTEINWLKFDSEAIHAQSSFPMQGRHILLDCQSCHTTSPAVDFAITASTCESCHQQNFLETSQPDHLAFGFSTDCQECHEMNRWKPAFMPDHDALFFPIFSGEHKGEWDDCTACHSDLNNRKEFTCLSCHEHNQQEMDEEHQGITGYVYNSRDCLTCHPDGNSGDFTAHDTQFFPIYSGEHKGTWDECAICHDQPDDRKAVTCLSCHEHNQQEMDKEHQGISGYAWNTQDCLFCHPSGEKGDFREHDAQFFPIFSGTHNDQWQDCAECHTVPENKKLFSCIDCHTHRQDKTDAEHAGVSGYAFNSTNCLGCHPSGEKGEFRDHDAQFFPIFSGTHNSQWNTCSECHTVPENKKLFSCIDCHTHRQDITDTFHQGMPNYAFNSTDCLACHPTGERGQFTDHDALFFPVYSGTHDNQWQDCAECHTVPENKKLFSCVDCHTHRQDKTDSEHAGISGYVFNSTNCLECHPSGEKGEFKDHDAQFFPIFSGTHNNQWQECAECHTVPSNKKLFSCIDCHAHARDKTDAFHQGMPSYVFNSTDCLACHPTGERGQFTDHDPQFFPIYSGTHDNQWQDCAECHTVPGNRKEFSCIDCHTHAQTKTDNEHAGINGYVYNSANCLSCHPSGEKGEFREHDSLYFPIYSGKHNNKWDTCSICHNVPGNNKAFTCLDCHEHSKARMDDKHLGEVNGYRYESTACYNCHPDGKE